MHRRTAHATPSSSSSKVAASRERRATRNKLSNGGGIRNINGNLPGSASKASKHHHYDIGSGKRILVLAIGLLIACLLLFWGLALFHVSTTSDINSSGGSNHMWGRVSLPKNALRRMRNGKSNYKSEPILVPPQTADAANDQSPYTAEALDKNPHLGWQPQNVPSPIGNKFSWRTCFEADPTSDGSDQPAGCKENPSEFGDAPAAEKDWVPDVTMIRKMMMYGKDRDGNAFPPPLSKELCEDIGVRGEKHGDINKESVQKSTIRATGALNSTTVTITPFNHFGAKANDKGTVEVPAPKLMCLVYTMADAHANRIRAMRDTWAGGCDGFLAFSTKSDPRLPAISLEHEGPEAYENVSEKSLGFTICFYSTRI